MGDGSTDAKLIQIGGKATEGVYALANPLPEFLTDGQEVHRRLQGQVQGRPRPLLGAELRRHDAAGRRHQTRRLHRQEGRHRRPQEDRQVPRPLRPGHLHRQEPAGHAPTSWSCWSKTASGAWRSSPLPLHTPGPRRAPARALIRSAAKGDRPVDIFDIISQQIANSLILGSFYALVALGYSMVYGIIKLLNFAHGDVYMVGAFIGFTLLSLLSGFLGDGWLGISASVVLSMIASGLPGRRHPAHRLPPAAVRAAAVDPDHRHGGLAGAVQRRHGRHLSASTRPSNTGLDFEGIDFGSIHISLHPDRAGAGHRAAHGGPDPLHQPDHLWQGHARHLHRHGRLPPDGHRRQQDHRPDLLRGLGPGRGGRASWPGSTTGPSTSSWASSSA